jgi:hypothetical protein
MCGTVYSNGERLIYRRFPREFEFPYGPDANLMQIQLIYFPSSSLYWTALCGRNESESSCRRELDRSVGGKANEEQGTRQKSSDGFRIFVEGVNI